MKRTIFICVLLLNVSCVEELDLIQETSFESVLVVEAELTNEFKHHKILLKRTSPLSNEELETTTEVNAQVFIEENGISIDFQEVSEGVYRSTEEFQAIAGNDYQLKITTSSGKTYASDIRQLTTATEIDELYFERDFNENNDEGVSIYVDAYDPTSTSKYYRFEYLEAYKIIAPKWIPQDLILDGPAEILESYVTVPRPIEEHTCYNEVQSNTILITNTLDLSEDRLDKHRVRFLNRDNYRISHRYTILIRQYVLSPDSYNYYQNLKNLASSESILSEIQVGYLNGNIFEINNSNEKVIGFFDVNFVDEKRIYFNYENLFPNEALPPYVKDCEFFFTPALVNPDPVGPRFPLWDALADGNWKYLAENPQFDPNHRFKGPFLLVVRECGDCTALGSSTPPDYWVE